MAFLSSSSKQATGQRKDFNGMFGCPPGDKAPCERSQSITGRSVHLYMLAVVSTFFQNEVPHEVVIPELAHAGRLTPILKVAAHNAPNAACNAEHDRRQLSAGTHLLLFPIKRLWPTCTQESSTQCIVAKVCGVLPRIKAEGSSKMLQLHMQASEGVSGTVL